MSFSIRLFRSLLFIASVIPFASSSFAGEADQIDFRSDIQPILAEHCARCHGVDVEARESGLRLDRREQALQGGDSGEAALVPGHAAESEMFRRITSDDDDTVMPPRSEKPLTQQEIDLIEKWIDQGAEYQEHWAFVAPQKKALPQVNANHPIDKFVRGRLRTLNMEPSIKANAAILCRRLYLDLIGLPPSPQELAAFAKEGFDATIDELLKNERFGEKWARHWLDVARYSDTNGYEKDLRRDQWAWRDWVIGALNDDMPYDQFVIEQIAGDLIPNATQDQIVATGFLRNSMLNEEGAIVPEQFRMVEMFDRLDCVGKAVLGLTTQCAQCHTHKFDPLTQDEYFGMFAFLNNAYEAKSPVYSDEQLATLQNIDETIEDLENEIRTKSPNWPDELQAWQTQILAQQADWTPLDFFELGSVSGLNHPVQLHDKSVLMLGHSSSDVFYIAKPDLSEVTGIRVELLTHGDLPFRGPGRSATGGWAFHELEVLAKPPGAKDWTKLKLKNATADYSEDEQKSKDGKKVVGGPVRLLIDGAKDTSWRADRGNRRRNQSSAAVVQFSEPLDFPGDTELKVAIYSGSMVGCVRVSLTTSPNPTAPTVDHGAVLAMQVQPQDRSDQQRATLFSAWYLKQEQFHELNTQIAAQWKRYPSPYTSVLHLAERESPMRRSTHLLDRGEWDRPRKSVRPHTPALLHAMPATEKPNRLDFATWLVSPKSPVAARVAVNRVWQAIFGEGLVTTPEDFGTRAPVPEHLDLLDWLAVDFMQHGWSHKRLIKQIVTSDTYQQSSRVPEEAVKQDPKNRLLARGPRFRCEAEVVRDIALTAAGLIHHKLGGPPVIPPVPQNVLDYNYVYPSFWKPTTGSDRYRRTLYGFRKRSMPDPVMSSFDAPNGDIACARRPISNTPIAALAGLNETIFFEAAQAMALRILREAPADDDKRINFAFQLCTARLPNEKEVAAVTELLESRRKRLADGWLNPREIVTGNPQELPELPHNTTPQDAAAWTLVSRVLLNLDETITKN